MSSLAELVTVGLDGVLGIYWILGRIVSGRSRLVAFDMTDLANEGLIIKINNQFDAGRVAQQLPDAAKTWCIGRRILQSSVPFAMSHEYCDHFSHEALLPRSARQSN